MSIAEIVMKMPCWYLLILILFSLYYAVKGIMEQKKFSAPNYSTLAQKVIILYVQEFLFKVIITASGFLALFLANYIFSSLKSVNDIGTGTAALLILLLIWGITGVSGYLTLLIVTGKLPSVK